MVAIIPANSFARVHSRCGIAYKLYEPEVRKALEICCRACAHIAKLNALVATKAIGA